MAQRRMFSLKVVDTDDFLDMPQTTQNLYFHFGMRADDDGFVSNPKKIKKMVNASDDDFKILISKQFVIPFQSGVIVIRHWRENNYIQSDRKHETIYKSELNSLTLDENECYKMDTTCIQIWDILDTEDRLGKDRLGKDRLGKDRLGKVKKNFIPPSLDEVKLFFSENNYKEEIAIKAYNHYNYANWHDANGKPVLNWKQKINTNWFKPEHKIPEYVKQYDLKPKLKYWEINRANLDQFITEFKDKFGYEPKEGPDYIFID